MTKISYFFRKCISKKTKQKKPSCFLFKPVLIFSTFEDIEKQAVELTNITSLLPLLSFFYFFLTLFLAPFVFSNTHLKKGKVS